MSRYFSHAAKATECLEKAIALDPGHEAASFVLAMLSLGRHSRKLDADIGEYGMPAPELERIAKLFEAGLQHDITEQRQGDLRDFINQKRVYVDFVSLFFPLS